MEKTRKYDSDSDEHTDWTPAIGQIIFVKNEQRFGDGPDWVPAIVTDCHRYNGGAMGFRRKDVFLCTVFYPQHIETRPDDFRFGGDHGETWLDSWEPGPGEPGEGDDEEVE